MTPEQTATIIHESAQATPTRTIAPMVGLDHSTIVRAQARLREHIDREAAELLTAGLTAARKTTIRYAEYGASPDCIPGQSDPVWAKIALDASKSITGILHSSQPSTIINALIQVGANDVPDVVRRLFAGLTHADTGNASMMGDEVVDVEQDGGSEA